MTALMMALGAGAGCQPNDRRAGRHRSLVRVLCHAALVFAFTAPLLLLNERIGLLAPGLPFSAIGVVFPALAAWLIARAFDGSAGEAAWWTHLRPASARYAGRILLLAAVLPASVTLLSVFWSRSAAHAPGLPVSALLAFAPIALAGAWLEEAGWSAYATETLRPSWPFLPAALLIGLIWALWHLIPLAQAGRSPAWIAWWTLGTVAMRVTLVGLYERGGHHVLAPALFHAVDNLCWQAQTTLGFEFNPRMHALLMTGIAILMTAWPARAQRQ